MIEPGIPLPFVAERGICIEDGIAASQDDVDEDELRYHTGEEAPLVAMGIVQISGDRADGIRSQYLMLTAGGLAVMLGCGPEHIAGPCVPPEAESVQDGAADWRWRIVQR